MSPDLLDPPAPALSTRELARRGAHLRAEVEHGVPARRRPLRTAVVAVAVLAVVGTLAAVLPTRLGHDRISLVSQALAAIGDRPTIHVVFDLGRTASLVDLRTGAVRSVDARIEIWSDPKLGTVFSQTLDGRVTERYGPRMPGSDNVSADLRAFVNGYRAQLRTGSYHTVGHGTVSGQPVEWVAGAPTYTSTGEKVVQEIAISRTSFKPIALRSRIGGVLEPATLRVLVAETLPRDPTLISHRRTIGGSSTAFPNGGHGIATTLAAARAAMNPDPVVPPLRLGGLERSWIGEPSLLVMPANSYRDQVVGVTFYYGRLYERVPAYTGDYVAITEVSDSRTAAKLWGSGLFRTGEVVVRRATGTLTTHGVYVYVQASSRARVIAAARALARAG